MGFAADSGLGQRGGGEISGPDKRQREKEEWMWRESGNKSKLQICLPDLAFVSSFHLLKWKRERNKRGNNQRAGEHTAAAAAVVATAAEESKGRLMKAAVSARHSLTTPLSPQTIGTGINYSRRPATGMYIYTYIHIKLHSFAGAFLISNYRWKYTSIKQNETSKQPPTDACKSIERVSRFYPIQAFLALFNKENRARIMAL